MGATATGKSDLAIRLAERFSGEIVSMDSRQVYIGMDIGTAKVPKPERWGIPHHLIDILQPDEPNSAGLHSQRAIEAIRGIHARRKLPILVGGTGLYFRAIFNGLASLSLPKDELNRVRQSFQSRDTEALYNELRQYDPARADSLSPNDRVRITRALEVILITGKPISEFFAEQEPVSPWEGPKWILTAPRAELRRRIAERTREMFEAGWVDEVRRLLESGFGSDAPGMKSLGYGEIAGALEAGTDPFKTVDHVITITCQYAKRQETFFRSEKDAFWFDVSGRDFESRIEEALTNPF